MTGKDVKAHESGPAEISGGGPKATFGPDGTMYVLPEDRQKFAKQPVKKLHENDAIVRIVKALARNAAERDCQDALEKTRRKRKEG